MPPWPSEQKSLGPIKDLPPLSARISRTCLAAAIELHQRIAVVTRDQKMTVQGEETVGTAAVFVPINLSSACHPNS